MRSRIERLEGPAPYKLVAVVEGASFLWLEGTNQELWAVYGPELVGGNQSREVFQAGDEVLIQLDPKYMQGGMAFQVGSVFETRAVPTYDLVGVIKEVFWEQDEPFKIKRISFSSVRQVPRR